MDIERLKVDESLWPEGATHFSETESKCFERHEDGMIYRYDGGWTKEYIESRLADMSYRIPRPEPRQVEWGGGGLPPVGCECEVRTEHTDWMEATIRYVSSQGCVIALSQGVEAFVTAGSGPQYRPIRTKEQREKDDLVEFLKQWNGCTIETMATVILTHYNLEPKQ